MIWVYRGNTIAPILGGLWMIIIVTSISILMSFSSGDIYKPELLRSFMIGALFGLICIYTRSNVSLGIFLIFFVVILSFNGFALINLVLDVKKIFLPILVNSSSALICFLVLKKTLLDLPPDHISRYEFESCVIRFLIGFGYIFFSAIVIIPFYVMMMTSFKSQSKLLLNP